MRRKTAASGVSRRTASAEQRRLERACGDGVDKSLNSIASQARALADRIDEARASLAGHPAPPRPVALTSLKTPVSRPAPQLPAHGLTGPQHRILDALAWLEGLGITQRASRVQVAFLAGYKPGGGAFNNTLGALRTAGLIDYPSSGEVALTGDGRSRANHPDAPLTTETLQHAVMDRLSGPQRRILQPLIDAYPSEVSTEDLARAAGYEATGGAFNNTVGACGRWG